MKIPERFRLRLSLRLALLVFLVEALLLGVFAAVVYFFCEREFYKSLDSALQANAEAIATLVDEEGDEGLELEFADEVMQRFSREKRPDLFAVLLPDGKVFEKSKLLEEMPNWVNRKDSGIRFENFRYKKHPYRGVVISVASEEDEPGTLLGKESGISIFFASSTHDIEEQLEDIAEFLGWFFGAGLVLSAVLAGLVIWRGLIPLRHLTRNVETISEETLNRRLVVKGLPPDLIPLAGAMNALLGRLEEAFERERGFSADAAHELRTPVAILKSGIQAALLNPPDEKEDRKVLSELMEDVNRLEVLCDSLLLVAGCRVDPDRDGMEVVDWIDDVKTVVDSFRIQAEENQCCLDLVVSDHLMEKERIFSDSLATRRIVSNLVDNAIRHGGSGTQITIRLTSEESHAQLMVEDNGPGVSPEDRPRLFERFFRADRARSRTSGGTGLGLAICRSLAEAWDGAIQYEALEPKGSRIVWHLRVSR